MTGTRSAPGELEERGLRGFRPWGVFPKVQRLAVIEVEEAQEPR